MKELLIKAKNKSIHKVLLDDEDFERASIYRWYVHSGGTGGKILYAFSDTLRNKGGKRIVMHRFILGVTDPKINIDHKDHNGLNNQRSNIRIATASQNSCNRGRVLSRNLSGFKGVSFKKTHNKYTAIICVNGVDHWGGHFNTPEEAASRYNELAQKYHGEFAYQNHII